MCGALASSIGQHASKTFAVSISNVTVSGTNVTTTNDCGGLIALVQGASSANRTVSISNCDIVNSTISVDGTGVRVGGLLGIVPSANTTISDIDVKGTSVSGTNKAKAVGGIVGLVSNAADFDRCTFEKNGETNEATVTGPTQHNGEASTGETPYTTPGGAYVGGIAGEVSGAASFDDCHVKNATVTTTNPGENTAYWKNMGGAFGYVHSNSSTIGATTGCSVQNTTVTSYHFAGGFIGLLDGGTISGCTVSSLTISGQNFIGGFVSELKSGTINNSSVSGTPITSANATVGGFAGIIIGGSMSGNSTSLQLGSNSNKLSTNNGGFAGQIWGGYLINCQATGNVYSNANYIGGFAGIAKSNESAITIEKCLATGNAVGSSTVGGLIGEAGGIEEKEVNIKNSYATGNMSGNVRRRGGLIAWVSAGTVNVSNCYATGTLDGVYEMGGLIGRVEVNTLTMTNCVGWSSRITATTLADNSWSTGALIGVTFPKCTLTNNYRNPSMTLTAFWNLSTEGMDSYQHPDVSSNHPLVIRSKTSPYEYSETSATKLASGQDGYPIYPYHGKVEAGKTLSQLASTTLGWDSSIWDFSGDLPTLR